MLLLLLFLREQIRHQKANINNISELVIRKIMFIIMLKNIVSIECEDKEYDQTTSKMQNII